MEVELLNTCTIDAGLQFMTFVCHKYNHVTKQIVTVAQKDKSFASLASEIELINEGKFGMAKFLWLTDVVGANPNATSVIDAYGS